MAATILVIDDSSTVRQQVRMALEQAGFSVVEAADGQEGLEQFRRGGFAMAVCDVDMPRLNGLDMLEQASAESLLTSTPVVMLTTEGQAAMVARAKAAGAKGWLVKPFNPKNLIAVANKICASAV